MIERILPRLESFVKGVLFDCHMCGQCVLRRTSFICPMRCPKGLRNGPCGGTLEGRCEVFPDRPCVWVEIHRRAAEDSTEPMPLLPSPDPALFFTSSYFNFFKGRDRAARTPLPPLGLSAGRAARPPRTASRLEQLLKSGRFAVTTELQAPRNGDLRTFHERARLIGEHFDAVNVTAYLHGGPSIPSSMAAAELAGMGIEPIAHATCRDHTKTSFVSELIQGALHGVHNVLCLTGDYYAGRPKIKQVFDMDAALMLYEARHLAETGRIHFNGDRLRDPPRPFLGAAINPFTTPPEVPIRRLKQKVLAGAEFIQTQLIFDLAAFREFMERYVQEGLDRELFLLAGIPLVLSEKAYDALGAVPGVRIPPAVAARLQGAEQFKAEGIRLARELIEELVAVPGVRGVHMMVFGSDYGVLPELARFARAAAPPAGCEPVGATHGQDQPPAGQRRKGGGMAEKKCGFYYLGDGAIGGECREFCSQVQDCLKGERGRSEPPSPEPDRDDDPSRSGKP